VTSRAITKERLTQLQFKAFAHINCTITILLTMIFASSAHLVEDGDLPSTKGGLSIGMFGRLVTTLANSKSIGEVTVTAWRLSTIQVLGR
jgi:hypothetical protein